MATYITLEQVLFIHDEMIRRFGGSNGVHDFGLLASAVARPQAGFGDFEAYPDIYSKAAVLCHSLLKNHSFIDGNKRTAVTSMGMFLELNGYRLECPEGTLHQLALDVATDQIDERALADWLRTHSQPF
jgi:death-on-curing protein